jgi:radical SAM protein with 4Fe4S-binding SPASM domain
MTIRRHSRKYNFIGDTITGTTLRWGASFEDDPIFAPWPELADISISNHCSKVCKYCYRDSHENNSFINLEDYKFILNELNHGKWGNVFQVALGGGEPLEHPHFFDIIKITRDFGIVPNFTTNGTHLNSEVIRQIENEIGALAISTTDITQLIKDNHDCIKGSKVKVNVHFLLHRLNLQQGIDILKGTYDSELSVYNAIIFLTYKPLGRAPSSNSLILNSELKSFIRLINNKCTNKNIGFDACFVPTLLHSTQINPALIDACECAFFSIYIDEKLNVKPCSFSNKVEHSFSLNDFSFEEIWLTKFCDYRKSVINKCSTICEQRKLCKGACPYFPNVTFCYNS